MNFFFYLLPLFITLGLLVGVLIFTASFTLVERKFMALYQRREGPDQIGFEGLAQPFADGLKLLRKETITPKDSPEKRIFFIAPIISLWISILLWAFIPFSSAGALVCEEVGLILVFGLSGLGSYGVIYAGWSSNNKYALLGAFRAVAQFISYEIILSILFLPIIGATGTTNLCSIVEYQVQNGWFTYLIPLWLLSFIVLLAETNRTPFDLPEAEAELVAGFNVEYSSLLFAFFFLAEYSGMGFFGALLITLFFGGYGYQPFGQLKAISFFNEKVMSQNITNTEITNTNFEILFFSKNFYYTIVEKVFFIVNSEKFVDYFTEILVFAIKIQIVCFAFIFVRASLPRKRFDQLILLCWKYFFPLVLTLVLLIIAIQFSAILFTLDWNFL